jgi:hypothetical protein
MMAQIGHVIKKVRVSEVRKITMDNAAAKNIAPQIRNAKGRLSIRARRSVERVVLNMNEAKRL